MKYILHKITHETRNTTRDDRGCTEDIFEIRRAAGGADRARDAGAGLGFLPADALQDAAFARDNAGTKRLLKKVFSKNDEKSRVAGYNLCVFNGLCVSLRSETRLKQA